MAVEKPSIPKGTRDFSPAEMARRNYIFDTIKEVFASFGYQPLETPAMENLTTLTGKYGEEGDRLLFKILNSGNFLSDLEAGELQNPVPNKLAGKICEKGLRYDLTVPFARFVVQHFNELVFPFKRYQIQPVWRGDNPQKGRYREFYQCDADVIGSNSLLNELELIQIIDKVFSTLGVDILIKLNNRKIITGISAYIGESEKYNNITIAVDKLEKIGLDKVNEELKEKGVSNEAISKLQPILNLKGTANEKLPQLKEFLSSSETGSTGITEIETLLDYISSINLSSKFEFDITLARGLNYYTGTILEVKAMSVKIGSVCGGGRYDDLTGIFGIPGLSGVGISFGADRIYDVMEQSNLFPEETIVITKLLFINFGGNEEKYCIRFAGQLRKEGISCEVFPEPVKIKKQIAYADKKKISFIALIGENEMKKGIITLKNMKTGEQEEIENNKLIEKLLANQ